MRLVDIDDAIEKAIESDKVVGSGIWETSEVVEYLEGLPTVDAVEVVRCKDCKYYNPESQRCDHPCLDYDVECFDHWIDTEPDDFCSYGERRDKDGV